MTIFLLVIVFLILLGIGLYNSLIQKKFRVKEAWSDIEVQLKRRYDLIPNLVETVKGYASHEKDLLEKITLARSQAMQGNGLEKMKAEDELSGALKSLFAVAENYPDLKANSNFIELQQELVDTEDKIQAARRFYNGVVRDYNIALKVFPSVLIAKVLHFEEEPLFEITNEAERETVKVQF